MRTELFFPSLPEAVKKLTDQVIIGERGVHLIADRVLEMGHAWNPATLDAGIDGRIELRNPATQEALNLIILVQSKATTQRFPAETPESFEWPCAPRDVDYWMQGNAPVILVVSRFRDGGSEAYWVDVKRYFADPGRRKRGRVLFDKRRDRFDARCSDALLELAIPTDCGIYLGPPPVRETIYSNLLRVSGFSDRVFTAQTDLPTVKAAWARFNELGKQPAGGEFVVRGKQILSFRDLNQAPFPSICDPGTVETHDTAHWAGADSRDLRRDFVELLNRTLSAKVRPQGVRFDGAERYYHFMPTPNLGKRQFRYRSRQKWTSREVFKGHESKKDPTRVAYYRHSAFRSRFQHYDGVWYLEITPTYRFTSDGRRPHPYAESYLKGIKEEENNDAVAGQVIMWAALLSRPAEFFAGEEFIRFDDLETFELDVGVDDARWLARDSGEEESPAGDEKPQLFLL